MKVKLIAALLYNTNDALDKASQKLTKAFGPIDFQSLPLLFEVTTYYDAEMGAGLQRILLSFTQLISPADLPSIKHRTIEIEKSLADEAGHRSVNIDSGYLDFDKVVLGSTKQGAYKLLMQEDIWADMTLHYEKGHYHPFPWTFADFKDGRYDRYLMRIRELYKKNPDK
ncbi:MAG: hypothetical protein A2293_10445 [Elusimicrobia bacterium RIFOXYB2_FULL_49_7]|nr:MAG: hypothetical protein A2293_10445 [Elusimicrobia bacterium RIFOXYB2_FULL_49_7]